ncbi:hypothetical protein HDN1F_02660 [gamma proteobacterium HdN1]|nr:hypothetical protein HDN1F_02660 [gamma proteobacterium HdN1]
MEDLRTFERLLRSMDIEWLRGAAVSAIGAVALLSLLAGCGERVQTMIPIKLTLDVTGVAASSVDAKVVGRIYGATYRMHRGENDEVTLIPISKFYSDSGTITRRLEFPEGSRDQLAVWAWQDLDGDGQLCENGAQDEPSGWVSAERFVVTRENSTVKGFSRLPGGMVMEQRVDQKVQLSLPLDSKCGVADRLAKAALSEHAHAVNATQNQNIDNHNKSEATSTSGVVAAVH